MTKLVLAAIGVAWLAGCATSPPTRQQPSHLEERASAAIGDMRRRDPDLGRVLQESYAYAVFPEISRVSGAGEAFGHGVLYRDGRPAGFVELEQQTPIELGSQTFSELVLLRDPAAVAQLEAGHFMLDSSAVAVPVDPGAALAADLDGGLVAFVLPQGTRQRLHVTLAGQRLHYVPAG